MKHKWGSWVWAVCLIVFLAGCSFARPEREGQEQDRFVGFHLVYEPIPASGEFFSVEDENWENYGSERRDLGTYGSAEIPQKILIGERQEDGSYRFPGKEGLNFFFCVQTVEDGEGEHEVRIAHSQLEMKEQSQHSSEHEERYTYSGVAFYGLPFDAEAWSEGVPECGWTAYEVYQMEDGTVYLTGDGNRYASAGGDFSFTQEQTWTERVNGVETKQAALSLTAAFRETPRVEEVVLQQYSAEQDLLAEETLTAQEALAQADGWTVPRENGTAYTLIIKQNADESLDYELFPEPVDESLPWETTLWFLDDQGMGWPVTVRLEP